MTRHMISAALVGSFFVLALFVRPLLHRRRTGKWGVHGLSGRAFSPGWWGGASFVIAMALVPAALLLPAAPSPHERASLGVALAGLVLTLVAQSGMGASWRIGVRETDRTALVTTGLFAWVRNPIFSGMLLFGAGLLALWPNWASFASLASLFLAVELQVRFVEEPWLRAVHGAAWLGWATRVGRFVPGLGRVTARDGV